MNQNYRLKQIKHLNDEVIDCCADFQEGNETALESTYYKRVSTQLIKLCLEQDQEDWNRLLTAYLEATKNHDVVFSCSLQELRKANNRGIDFVLRRLLANPEYEKRIRLYGAPSHLLAKNPFVDSKGYKWAVIRIKPEFLDHNCLHSNHTEET